MNITKEQTEAIRSLATCEPLCGNDTNEALDLVIRLGLCVLESGVTADNLRNLADVVDPHGNYAESPTVVMLDALARELEASR